MTTKRQLEVAMRALRWLAQCDDAEAREMAWYAISAINDMKEENNGTVEVVNRRAARD